MATYTLPKNWNAFNAWFTNFHKAFNTNAKKYGFSTNEIKAFNQFYKSWQNSFNAWNSFNTFSKTVNQFHTNEFAGYQSFVQNFISTIQSNKGFNGNWNSFFGSTSTVKATVKKTTVKKPVAKKSTAKKTTTTSKTVSNPIKSVTSTVKATTRTNPRAKATTVKKATKTQNTTKVTAKKVATKSTNKSTATKSVKPTTKKRVSIRAKSTTTQPVAKKTVAKKPVAKKTVAKKTVAKKTVNKPVATKSVNVTKAPVKRTSVRAKSSTSTKKVVSKANATTTNNAPFMWFSSGKSGVNVYVGSTKNGNFNLPTGTKGAYVEFKNSSKRWTKLTQGANFPFVHNYNGNGKVFYRACWINNNGKKGSWSQPISFTQNAVKAAA